MKMSDIKEALGEKPKEQKTEQGIDIFAEAQKANQSLSGTDTITIKGFGTFNVPHKYLVGNQAYKDAKTGRYAVANGITGDKKTLRFDRSMSPQTIVKTDQGHEVSIKLDSLSMNLKKHISKMPEGV